MRLLSYNIHKGIGGIDRMYLIERIIRVIEEEKPDLVCLQEVTHNLRRCRHHDQPQLLVKHFNPAGHLFQMNYHHKGGGYGNLILSRWPLHHRHQVSLQLDRRKARGAQMVVVDSDEGRFHLVNWHLGLAERERHWQTARLLTHPLFQESAHLPTVIAGDYNDWRNTLAGNSFREHGFDQITGPPARFRSFPAVLPALALDKAFYRGRISVRAARVVRNRLSSRASDHLPLIIDFHLGPSG